MELLSVLFPRVRAQVLRLLFADASRELHLRDLTRQTGLGLATVQGELAKLSSADLLTNRRDGNRRYYRANDRHPVFTDLQHLVLKTSGLREVLVAALGEVKGIEVAFVFGSLASGAGKAASDLDLMVIGNAGLRALSPAIRRATDELGREINPVTMTTGEFRMRRTKDPFLIDVLDKEKLFVKGSADDLGRLG
jgi:DNA-binding transcriptional ArsR family regulator